MNWFARGSIALALSATAASAVPLPSKIQTPSEDLGRMHQLAGSETITATVSLALRNNSELQDLVAQLYDRSGSQYRHFLTGDEFRARFAPTAATVKRITDDLRAAGLSVQLVNGTMLRVTGKAAAMEKAFRVEMHQFRNVNEFGAETRFHAPASPAQIRPEWEGSVEGIIGLDSRPRFRPSVHRSLATTAHPHTAAPNTDDPPGAWTVTDFAEYYDVLPLYNAGVTGKGQTIGIVTLASFTSSDVFSYWSDLGLTVSADRLKIVDIDNGPGAPSDASGSDETTLDVEQSGGLAPGAKMIVYQAPNSDQGFVDAIAAAVFDNKADAVSTSWGEWEVIDATDPDTVNNPGNGKPVNEITAMHNLFIQAACQGQSFFAAAGDDGSYDSGYPMPRYTNPLSVDYPASDTFITAAGGTTLPGEQDLCLNKKCTKTFTVNVKTEMAWSWDYLDGFCAAQGKDPVSCGIFPAGGGGGVSVVFDRPWYQQGLDGMVNSEKGQALVDTKKNKTLYTLPGNFRGRNLPDISFNADPDTGYVVVYTSDVDGFGAQTGWGGTSFVAPQLAGVTTLINAYAHGRVGLLNAPLYELAQYGVLYGGAGAPARDITKGDNEFYSAGKGYDQASGLGVLDVANFASLFR